jgi:Zn-dependent protease with chaperone function
MKKPANYYGARNSDTSAVQVFVEGTVLVIQGAEDYLRVNLVDVQSTPPLGAVPQEIRLANGDLIVLEKGFFVDELVNKRSAFVHAFEKNKVAWLAALILVPILIYFIVEKGIPAIAKQLTPLVPDIVTEKVDIQVLAVIDKMMMEGSQLSTDEQQFWSDNWKRLLSELSLDRNKYSLNFRSSEKFGANAFALPGGTVVVTDQLIQLLEQEPDAITAVLLHEIGHVENRHGMQLVAESVATTLLMTYLFGDMEGLAELFTGSFLTIIQNKFSQQLEQQADEFSVTSLKKLGISPVSLGNALTKLSKGHESVEAFEKYFSSHPSIKSRVAFAKSADN